MSNPPPAPNQQQTFWAARPQERPENCPPGLEYLLHVDQLLVKQQIEMLELFTGFETSNKYKVLRVFFLFDFFSFFRNFCPL